MTLKNHINSQTTHWVWTIIFTLVLSSCGKDKDEIKSRETLPPPAELKCAQLTDPHQGLGQLIGSNHLEEAALMRVNGYRRLVGARTLLALPKLTKLSENHAYYIQINYADTLFDGHAEQQGNPGYTGAVLNERAEFSGLDYRGFWIAESLSRVNDPELAVNRLMGTVYHRTPFLSPGTRYAGYAQGTTERPVDVFSTLTFADIVEEKTPLEGVVFPSDNMRDVPNIFLNKLEKPNPFPENESVGYPISVHFPRYRDADAGQEPQVLIGEFLLLEGNQSVPVFLKTPANDSKLSGATAFIAAHAPLKLATTYTVRLHAVYGGFELKKEWQFTTATKEIRFYEGELP